VNFSSPLFPLLLFACRLHPCSASYYIPSADLTALNSTLCPALHFAPLLLPTSSRSNLINAGHPAIDFSLSTPLACSTRSGERFFLALETLFRLVLFPPWFFSFANDVQRNDWSQTVLFIPSLLPKALVSPLSAVVFLPPLKFIHF